MDALLLKFTLASDATFGRGDGVAGLVDEEIQHDDCGLPFLNGRTLKGMLVAEGAEILYALGQAKPTQAAHWNQAAAWLFGQAGSDPTAVGHLRVGAAHLPDDLRAVVTEQVHAGELKRNEVLESLTTLRRQTAMDETGAPLKNTLRTMRVIVRQTPFSARLDFLAKPSDEALGLLAACVMAFHRAGTGRNRGRGRLNAVGLWTLDGQTQVTPDYFAIFEKAVQP